MSRKVNILAARRRKARHFAVQALYQWQMTEIAPTEIIADFCVGNDFRNVDRAYFEDLVRGVVSHSSDLELLFVPYLDRELTALDKIEKGVLFLSCFELRDRLDVPARVTLDEAVLLAKRFGATDSFRFVNGVLDKVAEQLRSGELVDS